MALKRPSRLSVVLVVGEKILLLEMVFGIFTYSRGRRKEEVGYIIHFLANFATFFTIIFENASEPHPFAKIKVIALSPK